MRLAELLPDAPSTWRGLDVTGVTADSRAVTPGALFFAFAGARADGMQFAAQALAAGAVAVVGEKSLPPELAGSPYIQVADARKSLSLAAAADPTADLVVGRVVMIGTDGDSLPSPNVVPRGLFWTPESVSWQIVDHCRTPPPRNAFVTVVRGDHFLIGSFLILSAALFLLVTFQPF